MRLAIPRGKPLFFYGFLSWVVPALMAGIVCLFAFFGSAAIEQRNDYKRLLSKLDGDARISARRLAAEILIGERGAPKVVAKALTQEFSLYSVSVDRSEPKCWKSGADLCHEQEGTLFFVYRNIPAVPETAFVRVAAETSPFVNYLRLKTLLWSTLPIGLMLLIGLLFQRWVLGRYILKPIQSLVETSTGEKEPRIGWPKELRDISARLYQSFEKRDEAIFSQVARGVIHDLRTLIQSPLTALELTQEAKESPEKHASKLRNLEVVIAEQLPKMRDIIDTTLDGSRDIPIQKKVDSVQNAVRGAIRSLQPLLEQTGTTLTLDTPPRRLLLAHDSRQLERVLTNLFKNGIEACVESRSTNKQLSVELKDEPEGVRILVEDSGPGLTISSDRVFRPLKSTKPHGSGLGLVISRKIVAAHGGAIHLGRSSRLGGASFEVVIPKSKEAQ